MPNKKVYFGTLDDMQWVPAPQANSTYNKVSWRASGTFLNGGGYQRQSGTSHKELSLSWSVQQLEMIDKVLAQFNKGEMLYYIDPIAAKYNVLPPYVAQYQPDNPQGVDFVDTGSAGALGYPRKAAVYSGANTLATVPVPAGQNLWVGAHGNAIGGGGVSVSGVTVPILSVADSQRVNTKVAGGQNLTISTTGTGSVQLNGLIAQILPEGETPEPGGFISGQGHSGLRLNGDPMITQYSANIPNAQIGVSAEFIETGAWE